MNHLDSRVVRVLIFAVWATATWCSPLIGLVVAVGWLSWKVYARDKARAAARANLMEGADQSDVIS